MRVFKKLAGVLLFVLACGYTGHSANKPVTSIQQLNDPAYTVSVTDSGAAFEAVKQDLPRAKRVYIEGVQAYDAVRLGKVDAYAFDRRQMEIAIAQGLKGVRILPGHIGEPVEISVGLSRASKIPNLREKINNFIAELKADGTLEGMYNRWVITSNYYMPDIDVPESANLTLRVGTTGMVPPYSYYEGNKLTGYDVELARRFAKWLGASVKFRVYDYGGVIAAAATGEIDCIMADLNITPERAEKIDYSDVLFTEEVALMVKDNTPAQESRVSSSLQVFDGKRIGVFTGSIHDKTVQALLPSAKLFYFDGLANAISALESGKIDAIAQDDSMILMLEQENHNLTHIDEYLSTFDNAFIFTKSPKGDKIREEFNEFIRALKSDGTLEQLQAMWSGSDDSVKTLPDYENYPATNGTLEAALDNEGVPFVYVKDGRLVGYEVDVFVRFCKAKGYKPKFSAMNFPSVLPAVMYGKSDLGLGTITITPERAESVNFSESVYTGGALLLVRKFTEEMKPAEVREGYTRIEELDGKRIGVLTGSIGADILKGKLPAAKALYIDNYANMVNDLSAGKIDAILEDDFVVLGLEHDNPSFKHIDGYLRTFDKAFIFTKSPKGDKLRSEFNEFLRTLKADGTLKQISDVWIGFDESRKILPDYENYPATNGTVKFAVDNTTPTFSYVKDGRIVGYDVDLLARFCKSHGYRPEPVPMNFSGELPAVHSGKCLVGISAIAITPERAETVNFSEPVYTGGAMLLVKKSSDETKPADTPAKYRRIADLNGKRIGVPTGAMKWEAMVRELLPDSPVTYYSTIADFAAALETRKIDAFPCDVTIIDALKAQNKNIAAIDEVFNSNREEGIAFPKTDKGRKLQAQWNEYITFMQESGKLDAMMKKWTGSNESAKTIADYESFPAPNGVLTTATNGTAVPYSYYKDGKLAGFQVDLAVNFCEAYGYGLEFKIIEFGAIVAAVQSGKCDFGVASMEITEERSEKLLFSKPYYKFAAKMVVRAEDLAPSPAPVPAETPKSGGKYTRLSDLNGKRIGVQTGVEEWADIVRELLPDSRIIYYNTMSDLTAALKAGKIESFACDSPVLALIIAQNDEVASLGELLEESFDVAVAFPKNEEGASLKAQWDEFITSLKNEGKIDALVNKWTGADESAKTIMDYSSLPATNGTLKMATEGEYPPFNYYRDNALTGFEIELAAKFAEKYGYGLEVKAMSYDAIFAAVQSGRCDFGLDTLTPKPEHAENMLFSVPYYACSTKMAVLAENLQPSPAPAPVPEKRARFTTIADLAGTRIGAQTGTANPQIAAKAVPTAKIEEFNDFTDILIALRMGKIDAACLALNAARFALLSNEDLTTLDKPLAEYDAAPIFAKTDAGRRLCEQYNEFIRARWDDGTIQRLDTKWFSKDDSKRVMKDYANLPAPNGTLKMAVDLTLAPFAYVKDSNIVGYEVELAEMFCEAKGYGLQVVPMSFGAIVPAVMSGKCDFASCTIAITPERAESVQFGIPNAKTGCVIVVRKSDTDQESESEFSSLAGKRIGVTTGTTHPQIALDNVPTARLVYFDNLTDTFAALKLGKVDAVCTAIPIAKMVMAEDDSFEFFGEQLTHIECAPIFAKTEKGRKLCDEFSEFLKAQWDNGTIQEMDSLWFSSNENKRVIKDYSRLPSPNGVLKVAAETSMPPFIYVKNNRITGYDVDTAVRFCEAYGYGLKIVPMSFAGIIPAVVSGKCDFGLGGITRTPEREESVLFSYPSCRSGNAFVVRKSEAQAPSSPRAKFSKIGDLSGKRIGVTTGTTHEKITLQYVPDAKIVYFNNNTDTLAALKANKIDAACTGTLILREMMTHDDSITSLGEQLTFTEGAPMFPKTEAGRKLCEQVSEFAKACWNNGTIKQLESMWFDQEESRRKLKDYSALPSPNGTLRVAVNEIIPPCVYMKDNRIVGYDVDFMVRFCEAYGYGLKVIPMSFAAIIPALQSGKCDLGIGAVTITEERKESVLFSYPNLKAGNVFAVRKSDIEPQTPEAHADIQVLAGKRIGVQTGTNHPQILAEFLPNAQLVYFENQTDLAAALNAHKIDAFCTDIPVAEFMISGYGNMTQLGDKLTTIENAPIFPKTEKGRKLCEEFSEFTKAAWNNGTIQELESIWFSSDASRQVVKDYSALPAPNGKLKMAVDTSIVPFSYVKDNKPAGYCVDFAVRFCEAYGYGLEIIPMNVAAIIPALMAGKCDFADSSFTITEERAENVLFSYPNVKSGTALFVKNADASLQTSAAHADIQVLAGKYIAVQTGMVHDKILADVLPTVQLLYFDSQADIVTALRTNKVDAFCSDIPVARFMTSGYSDITQLGGALIVIDCAPIFPKTEKGNKLCNEFTEFIKAAWNNGTIRDLESIWFGSDDSKRVVKDYSTLPAPNGKLRMAVDHSLPPFVYMKSNRIVGYEVDCAARFCEKYGYGLEVVPMNFAAIIPELLAGKCDFGASAFGITEERAKSVLFAAPNMKIGTGLFVRKSDVQASGKFAGLAGKRVGVRTGTNADTALAQFIPEARCEYFDTVTDVITALKTGKVDAICTGLHVARYVMLEQKDLAILGEPLTTFEAAPIFAKTPAGQKLCNQFSEFIKAAWDNGTIAEIDALWFSTDEAKKVVKDYAKFPAPNGTLKMAVDPSTIPFVFMKDEKFVGYEVDMAARFCEAYGYGLEVVPMNFSALISAVQTGKCDFAASGLFITPERQEQVLFAYPNTKSGNVIVVRKAKPEPQKAAPTTAPRTPATPTITRTPATTRAPAVPRTPATPTFLDELAASFNRTFIREERWRLFVEGIINTMIITVLSILCGTILGFVVYLACRGGNVFANLITRFFVWLIQGTPMVVLLMILYYIIFGKVDIEGIWVAVIAFSLTFGAGVYGMLLSGTGALDKGQTEAAYALGFTDRRAFFTIILPQAALHFMPAYKAEVVALIKATAIVGYIAVQDLTKMGDIVRSRTYEAFFPLIAVAVIYFVLAGILNIIVGIIHNRIRPEKRTRDDILKGIDTHD